MVYCIFYNFYCYFIQLEKIKQELEYLEADKEFELSYGWAWFLKLHQELKSLGDIDRVF
jgi:hypothetical protein